MNIHKCSEAARWKAEVLQMMWDGAKKHAAGAGHSQMGGSGGLHPTSPQPARGMGWDGMGWEGMANGCRHQMPPPLECIPICQCCGGCLGAGSPGHEAGFLCPALGSCTTGRFPQPHVGRDGTQSLPEGCVPIPVPIPVPILPTGTTGPGPPPCPSDHSGERKCPRDPAPHTLLLMDKQVSPRCDLWPSAHSTPLHPPAPGTRWGRWSAEHIPLLLIPPLIPF